jgi:N-acyl-D-aspartate/D-glutamate deacylase
MTQHDLIIRNGMIYDGSGVASFQGDVAIDGDTIAAVGQLADAQGKTEIDVNGLAVAPGFINMLSWSVESLIEDGRSQSEIRQGVTLEVMGEGASMGPLNEEMKKAGPTIYMNQGDIKYEVEWSTLGEYLEFLERRGVSTNITSFVGTSTLRVYVMGYEDRVPTEEELEEMCDLVRQAMEEGAVGLSAALIYPPAYYASTEELIALASAAAEYNGLYISHIRSEGTALLDAMDEFLTIAEITGIRAEIYHLKAAGQPNWDKMDEVIEMVEEVRAENHPITADMYTYPFGGTGLNACIPPWAHEGGHPALIERLKNPADRERIKAEMLAPSDTWENMYLATGAENILLSGFKKEEMKYLTGKRLTEVAAMRSTPPEDTLMDLIVEDDSRIFTMYFSISEENMRKQIALPWVSFCSDAESMAPEGVFLKSNPHPRAYGSFARLLAKYVRDEKIIPLEEAVRRLTSFPANNLRLDRRGSLQTGYFADVVVFDPEKIQDHATPENPHQYSTGMVHVFVNGTQVLKDGEHTGEKPGRVVRGPGWKKSPFASDYAAPVDQFLILDEGYNGTYNEFDIGYAQVDDLIRMATDTRLHFYNPDKPQAWAPMHAWRRLAQLEAKEAIEPLIEIFEIGNPFMLMNEMPTVYGMLGAAAIPALADHLSQAFHPDFDRAVTIACIRAIAESSTPEIFDICESILAEKLEKYEENNPSVNAILVSALVGMGTNAVPVIHAAYTAKKVDENLAGTWKETAVKLGVRMSDELRAHFQDEFDDDDDDLPLRILPAHKADAKKKAKRKQAAKTRKLNRKRKR